MLLATVGRGVAFGFAGLSEDHVCPILWAVVETDEKILQACGHRHRPGRFVLMVSMRHGWVTESDAQSEAAGPLMRMRGSSLARRSRPVEGLGMLTPGR